jgi:ribosomal protein S18 acetylase RimI-like enzyme
MTRRTPRNPRKELDISHLSDYDLAATQGRVEISLLGPAERRPQDLRNRVPETERYLFDKSFWSSEDPSCAVHVVAVAAIGGDDLGLATLGRVVTEDDEPDLAAIFGAWVDPVARGRGVGTQLLLALADESPRRYGTAPRITGVTEAGRATIVAALRWGAEFDAGD